MRVDLHMHTGYSADAQYPQSIDDKIHACEQAGLDIIGITDHLDFLRSGGTRDNRDPEACAREVWEKRRPAGNGGIEVLAGMEIGQLHATPDADDFVRTHPFDMVIGSLHAMPNDLDIYFHDFPNMDCDKFLHEYFDQLLLLEEHGEICRAETIKERQRIFSSAWSHFVRHVSAYPQCQIPFCYTDQKIYAGCGTIVPHNS